jgi:ribonuclease HI
MPDSDSPPDEEEKLKSGLYMLFIDGAKRANAPGQPTAVGAIEVVLKDPKGRLVPDGEISRVIEPIMDPYTAEYLALLAGLELARQKDINGLVVFSDSRTLVNQVNKLWKHHTDHLEKLCVEAQEALSQFTAIQVPGYLGSGTATPTNARARRWRAPD